MPTHGHIYKPFDAELRALKDQVLAMGGLVEAHIADAMAALTDKDVSRAQHLIASDRAVDAMEIAIDEQCIRMLALRQPAASDLRFIASTLKIVTDLERVGDLAVNMGERALALIEEPAMRVVIDLPEMAAAAQRMLSDALDAFVTGNVAKAESVLDADDRIDAMMVRVFDEIMGEMQRDPAMVRRGIAMIFFAKHIERLADHTTNVAEMVVYMVRGHDVRHKSLR
jgi:phosphate transport system protein